MPSLRNYFWQLQRSFEAVYYCLEKPRLARRAVVALLLIHSGLLAYSAYVHSPTLNEPGHLVAGLSNWEFGRFDIYCVNPPLIRMVAALPVIAVGYEEDWSSYYTGSGARPEFAMGEDFVAANGERSFFLFMIARWACIPFSWMGGIVCYLWARDLYGHPAGVMACSIWCFEPNILAHASLMTPDAHATALGLAACYTFWRWLRKPTWSQAAITGIVLGLAELTKTTLILFYPLWPLMWLVYRWPQRRLMTFREWARQAGMLALRMAIGLYVLNLGYQFEASLKPLGEFQFVSNLFAGKTTAASSRIPLPSLEVVGERPLNLRPTNRFADTLLGALPVPLPANYLVGIDLQQHDFEDYGHPSYLRGQRQDRGWWYYYLYAVAIKVPLGLWALVAITLALRLRHLLPNADYTLPPSTRDEFILLFPALLVFWVVSSKTGFNEHMRYVLPAFPFFFIWVCGAGLTTAAGGYNPNWSRRRTIRVPLLSAYLVAVCWLVTSSFSVYPHSLSYFNESIGGPLNGAEHLLGSNVDWGQDLRYVKWWLEEHPRVRPVYLAFKGLLYDPARIGIVQAHPFREGIVAASQSFLVISVNDFYEINSRYRDAAAQTQLHLPAKPDQSSRVPINYSAYLLQRRSGLRGSDGPVRYSDFW